MASRTTKFYVTAVIAVFALSGCSTAAGVGQKTSGTAGTIELAVSETCVDGSDSQCVSINGESVLVPSAFERADVAESSVAADGQNAVDVTFNQDGAMVFHTLTEKAATAGSSARLVMKIGGELKSAVRVMEAMEGDQVQIVLSADDSAMEISDLLQRN